MKITFEHVFLSYFIAALLTFGYATNADWEPYQVSEFNTPALHQMGQFTRGALAGMMWPLYLVYKGFKWVRPTDTRKATDA